MFSAPIQKLIDAFVRFPGVGPKTAERFVMYLLKSGRGDVARLTKALTELLQSIRTCERCQNFTDISPCAICADSKRDQNLICVVAEPQDIIALERIHSFPGVYHILRGLIQPLESGSPEQLRAEELVARLQTSPTRDQIEVVFAFDPTIEGEATIQYLKKMVAPLGVKMSRLATGLPAGGSVEYADEITLENALRTRQKLT